MTKKNQILLVGLGNPGEKYKATRHNIGFMFLDWFSKNNNQESTFKYQKKLDCEIALTTKKVTGLLLAKPQTYMNNSGFAVKKTLDFYKIYLANLVVVHDDLDLPFGTIRVSKDSGAAGHNGVKSIIEQLGNKNFTRLRVGISNSQKENVPSEKFVLNNFSAQEQKEITKKLFSKIEQALNDLLEK